MTRSTLLILFSSLVLISEKIYGQSSGQASISGFVFVSGTSNPLEAATIRVFSERDSSLAGGAQTDASGYYVINDLRFDRYRIVASMVGHGSVTKKGITLNAGNSDYNADTIYLKQGETTTEEIDVTAERSFMEFQGDKKIYNVEKSQLDKGGNATDLLRKIPALTVDQDGNVSLRGSPNVKFMIDGVLIRQDPAGILDQTSADAIESVEILTNPGAKYEVEGEAGLINIVLKKGSEIQGYNGQLSLGVGNSDRYNAGLSIGRKNNALNAYGNYNYRDFDNTRDGGSVLTNFNTNSPKSIEETTTGMMKRMSHLFKGGTDFFLTPTSTLGLSATYQVRNRNNNEKFTSENLNELGQLTSSQLTNSGEDDNDNAFDAIISFNKMLSSRFHTLSGEAVIGFENEQEDISSMSEYFDSQGNMIAGEQELKNSIATENVFGGTVQIDLVQPLSQVSANEKKGTDGKGKTRGSDFRSKQPARIETGVKLSFRDLKSSSDGDLFDYSLNTFVPDTSIASDFNYRENIYSGYATFADKLGNFDINAGARVEATDTRIEELLLDSIVDRNYFDIFPSVALSYDLSLTDKLQANYSRRINRPPARFLVPSIDNSNPTNISAGNPNLKPEYVNSAELSYLKFFSGFSINPSIFYRHTTDEITRFRTLIDSVTTFTTFENLEKSDSYGAEIILGYSGQSGLNINASANYSYDKLTGSGLSEGLDNSGGSWSAKINAGMKVWYDIDVQLAYNYQGQRPTILGYIEPVSDFEAGFKKDFLDDALSIGLRFTDIFNQQSFKIRIDDDEYTQDFYRNRNNRYAYLTLTYNFGAKEKQNKKRREGNDDGGADIDF